MLEKYLKGSSKRLTNMVCLVLISAMVIANICGVSVDTTIFITLAGVIGGNGAIDAINRIKGNINNSNLG